MIFHAARLDGLGEFEIIWRIMIPMTAPALAAFGIFSIVAHWNDLFWPLIAVRREEIPRRRSASLSSVTMKPGNSSAR